jgi:hypothetical protein
LNSGDGDLELEEWSLLGHQRRRDLSGPNKLENIYMRGTWRVEKGTQTNFLKPIKKNRKYTPPHTYTS